jgi:hypothetical protein
MFTCHCHRRLDNHHTTTTSSSTTTTTTTTTAAAAAAAANQHYHHHHHHPTNMPPPLTRHHAARPAQHAPVSPVLGHVSALPACWGEPIVRPSLEGLGLAALRTLTYARHFHR